MSVGARVRYEVLARDDFACQYCGAIAPQVQLHVDHIVARALGGSDKPENLVTACSACNLGKSAAEAPVSIRASTEVRQAEWVRYLAGELDEDDERDVYFYQRALSFLEDLPADQVLHYIARTFAAALPYRPTHAELIRAAGDMAEREHRSAQIEVPA